MVSFFFKLHLLLHEKVCHLMIEHCLTIREQHFNYIQDENKFNNIWKLHCTYRNEGRDGSIESRIVDCHWQRSIGSRIVDCHWQSMESWLVMTNLVFCSNYNVPTLFFSKYMKEVFNVPQVLVDRTQHPPFLHPTPLFHFFFYIFLNHGNGEKKEKGG